MSCVDTDTEGEDGNQSVGEVENNSDEHKSMTDNDSSEAVLRNRHYNKTLEYDVDTEDEKKQTTPSSKIGITKTGESKYLFCIFF